MNLSDILFSLPSERLRHIVHRRAGTLRTVPRISNKRELAQFLASALTQPESVERAIEDTSMAELQLLSSIVARGGSVRLGKLMELAGAESRGRLGETIEKLESLALAFTISSGGPDDRTVVVPKSVQQHTPLPLPVRYQLPVAYEQYDSWSIARICENLGLKTASSQGTEQMARAIALELGDPPSLKARIETLSEEARTVLQWLVDAGGEQSVHSLAVRLGGRARTQLIGGGWTAQWASGKPRNGVEELFSLGIAVVDSSHGWGRWNIVLPAQILGILIDANLVIDILPEEPVFETIPPEEVSINRHESLLRDVAWFLGSIGRSEAAHTGSGNMHRVAIRAMSKGLSIRDPRYAEFVYALARDAGLIAPKGRRSIYDLGPAARPWLNERPEIQLRALYSAWRGRASWAESYLHSLTELKDYRSASLTDRLRTVVIATLVELEKQAPGQLASIASLHASARFTHWSVFVFDSEPDEETERSDRRKLVASNRKALERVLCESLYWLGGVEVSGDSEYARISPLLLRFLRDEPPAAEPEAPSNFVLQPNLEIYAPPDMPARDLVPLFRVTEPAEHGMVAITRESLRSAFDNGDTVEGVLTYLKARSQTGVPQNVEYLIRDVGSRHGHVRVGQAGLYIQVSDPMLLKELRAQKGLKVHFREDIADTVALITGDSVESVLSQLRKAGYFPIAAEDRSGKAVEAPSYPMVQIPARAAAKPGIDAKIDWAAIAASEKLPKSNQASAQRNGHFTNPAGILKVLIKATRDRDLLCVLFSEDEGESPSEHRMRISHTSRVVMTGYCATCEQEHRIPLQRIQSVHFTTGK